MANDRYRTPAGKAHGYFFVEWFPSTERFVTSFVSHELMELVHLGRREVEYLVDSRVR